MDKFEELMSTDQMKPLVMASKMFGQHEMLSRIVRAAIEKDMEELDKVLDLMVPTMDGMAGTMLPSFAMTFTAHIARGRPSWRALRDRLFKVMEDVRAVVPPVLSGSMDEWFKEYESYSARHDVDHLGN